MRLVCKPSLMPLGLASLTSCAVPTNKRPGGIPPESGYEKERKAEKKANKSLMIGQASSAPSPCPPQ